jgi:hypothetical protein
VPVDDLLRLALINHAMAFGLDYAQAAAVVDRAVEAHPGMAALALAEQVRDVIYALPWLDRAGGSVRCGPERDPVALGQ